MASPELWEMGNGGFPKLGVPYWGSYSKDCSILGSTLGSPYFGKLPNIEFQANYSHAADLTTCKAWRRDVFVTRSFSSPGGACFSSATCCKLVGDLFCYAAAYMIRIVHGDIVRN